MHATPLSEGGAVSTATLQLVPFHCSMSERLPPMSVVPAAKQEVAAMHETPARPLELAPDGLGLLAMVHLVPFHRSTSAEVLPVEDAPTAKQFVAPVHDTPWRELP